MSTHRWRERPQPALREYIEEDGVEHLQHAHRQQVSFLQHHPRVLGHTNWLGNAASYLWDKEQLLHGVRQVRGSELRVIITRHPQQTCSTQVHGCTPLRLPAPQDARQDRGADLPWRFEEVVHVCQML
jgi:hypothetical protein